MRILFVCLGNICRSPAAEAVCAQLAAERGIDDLELDSAGTADYHVGESPHRGTITEAARRGVPIEHRGRQVTAADFATFGLLVAVDRSTERNLRRIAPVGADLERVVLLGSYAPDAVAAGVADVADPWGHPQQAYSDMWDHLEVLCGGLLDQVGAPEVS